MIHTRRHFLNSSLAASLAAAGTRVLPAQQPRPLRVDSHLHCFAGPADNRFPYHDQAPYKPGQPATPEHLLACMGDAGVDYAIVVHPEPYQDDHRYLEHCLAIGKDKLKGTVLVIADRAGSLEKLSELCRKLPIVAARIHAHAADRLPPFGKPELKRLWSLATDHGLAVQLHFTPRYAPGFEPLIREFPKTKVIIDHMGRPFQGTPAEHAVVLRWANFDNTMMKLSSLSDERNDPARLRAVIRQLTDGWGADRMIFGDSFGPTTTGVSYRESFERAASLLDHLNAADRAKIFALTAARLFGFKKQA